MQELKGLLIEWAALESDRCHYRRDSLAENASVRRGLGLYVVWVASMKVSAIGLDILQGAIQEAVSFRRCLFTLESATDELCYARIRNKAFDSASKSWYGQSPEGAIALLEAWVECLKGLEVKS